MTKPYFKGIKFPVSISDIDIFEKRILKIPGLMFMQMKEMLFFHLELRKNRER